jgi:hypothetical protein
MKKTSFVHRYRPLVLSLMMFLMLMGGMVTAVTREHTTDVYAGIATSGDQADANFRALITSNGTDRVKRVVYFKLEPHATGGANTPVASGKVCDLAGTEHFAQVAFSGTLAGSAPTLVVKWQNSKDNGATWTDVGTWTTINATVTPATQSQSVGDLVSMPYFNGTTTVNSTATIYGDCWRATYTMGAAGAGTFSIVGMDK